MFLCNPDVSKTISDHSGHFRKTSKFSKNVDFTRVSFQFLAQGLRAVRRISGLTTYLGRSFQGLVEPNPVLAGMAETHRKNPVKGLNATLAGGPFILGSGPGMRVLRTT